MKNVEVEIFKNGIAKRYQVSKEKWPSIHYKFNEEEKGKKCEIGHMGKIQNL